MTHIEIQHSYVLYDSCVGTAAVRPITEAEQEHETKYLR